MQKQNKTKSASMPIGRKKISAFTLVEIMIVLAITMFLLTLTLQNSLGSVAQLNFINSANKVIDMVRQARSLAIAGKAQPDYTDFNKNGCIDSNIDPCPAVDLVTPAGYGLYFVHHNDGTEDEAILFIDNHVPAGGGGEGHFLKGVGITDYRMGGTDVVLETFTLPKGISFIGKPPLQTVVGEASGGATVIYTPIFADVIFDNIADPRLFTFGLSQSGSVSRTACFQIHKVSGIPTPTDNQNCPST